MRATSLALALALFFAGCAAQQAAVIPAAAAVPVQQLQFIADDFPAAVAAARARGVPIFVDVWAPW